MNQLVVTITQHAPAIIAGDRASYRFLEFFTAQIRNSEHASRTFVLEFARNESTADSRRH
jgi:hypothetical protein